MVPLEPVGMRLPSASRTAPQKVGQAAQQGIKEPYLCRGPSLSIHHLTPEVGNPIFTAAGLPLKMQMCFFQVTTVLTRDSRNRCSAIAVTVRRRSGGILSGSSFSAWRRGTKATQGNGLSQKEEPHLPGSTLITFSSPRS